MSSLLDSLSGLITPDLLKGASSTLGESEASLTKAAGAAFPALLSGILAKSGDGSTMQSVFNMANQAAGANALGNLSGVLGDIAGGRTSTVTQLGTSFLSSIFGNRVSSIVGALGQLAGLKTGSANSLISLAAPMVLGVLGNRIKSGGLNVSSLTSLLHSEKDSIMRAAPSALTNVMGLGDIGRVTSAAMPAIAAPAASGRRWLWPVLAAAALGVLYFARRTPQPATPDTSVAAPAPAAAPATPTPDPMNVTLPGGVTMMAHPGSVERSLVEFIQDANKPVDNTTWFDFQNLRFDTGKATLQAGSTDELKNVATILAAYPNVTLKIGGYTDNVGSLASNMKLSTDRANTVMSELVTMGVNAARLAAEGYGPEHPIADNATTEGRAKNRRIAMRVTAK